MQDHTMDPEIFGTPKRPALHGSDVEFVAEWYNIPKETIVCYSDNVNPLGISPKLRKEIAENIDVIHRYPDRSYTDLRNALHKYCEAPMEHILVGSGATNLISRFMRETCPDRVVLISPTYSEYEREVHLVGGEILHYQLKRENDFRPDMEDLKRCLENSVDLLIFCNPNNPTGYAMHHDELRDLYTFCDQRGINILVDETYVEFAPNVQDVTSIPLTEEFPNVFVLRGISKYFSVPGLRFGYGVTTDAWLFEQMNDSEEPWGINSIAEKCLPAMFEDNEYIDKTNTLIQAEREEISNILRKREDVKVYPTEANFLLVQIKKKGLTSADIFDALIKERMMIRDCSSFSGLESDHIRFHFRTREDNERLLKKLLEVLQKDTEAE